MEAMSRMSFLISPTKTQRRKAGANTAARNKIPLVVIDSDYPSDAAMEVLRKLPVPKLRKTTKSLF